MARAFPSRSECEQAAPVREPVAAIVSPVAPNASTSVAPVAAIVSRNGLRSRARPPMFASSYSYDLTCPPSVLALIARRDAVAQPFTRDALVSRAPAESVQRPRLRDDLRLPSAPGAASRPRLRPDVIAQWRREQ